MEGAPNDQSNRNPHPCLLPSPCHRQPRHCRRQKRKRRPAGRQFWRDYAKCTSGTGNLGTRWKRAAKNRHRNRLHQSRPPSFRYGSDYFIADDLLNQCIGSALASVDSGVPYIGLYGACSTMAEGLALGAALIDGGSAHQLLTAASSQFCSAERQYRFPLTYGGQRPPTAQWTATAAGAAILSDTGPSIRITHAVFG